MFLKRWWDETGLTKEFDESTVDFVDDVLRGNFTLKSPTLHDVLRSEGLNEYISYADSHLERVQIINQCFKSDEFLETLKSMDESLSKNEGYTKLLMQKSENSSSCSDIDEALRIINLGALFANQKSLGEIYRKRSSLLFNIGNSDDCLKDTELGLQIKCPMAERQELNFRKSKCLAMYRKSQKPELIARKEYRDNVLFQLYKGENVKIPGASSVVEIRWSEKNGRGLFVTEDVDPGTTLIIENPYVTNLHEGLNWDVSHCWRCLKRIQNPTPCYSCVFAVYCNEKCRLEDFRNGHHYECPCLPYFHGASIGPNTHLGFKSICKSGPLELYEIFITMDTEDNMGFDPKTGTFDSKTYWPVMNQKSHIENYTLLPEQIWVALSFTEILDKKTDFFAQISEDAEKERFKEFVASLALANTLSTPFNCVGLSELDRSSRSIPLDHSYDASRLQRKSVPFAAGLYPFTSLMNHTCDFSMGRSNLKNGKMAIMTLRGMKAGDELLWNYGFEYGNHSTYYRFQSLLELYSFKCRCTPCKYDWPLYEDLSQIKTRFRCPNCSDKFSYDESTKCALEDLDNGIGTCPLCFNQFSFQTLIHELQSRAPDLELAKQFLMTNYPVSAIVLLLDYIKFLQFKLCPPSFSLCAAQRFLLKAYNLIMDD